MGYTTEFSGQVTIDPPLNLEEINYLMRFNETDYNDPPEGQPGLWCQWIPNDDGTAIEWDGGEKFYEADKWMKYLIEHFLQPGALAASLLPFLQANHIVNGTIEAQGEDPSDRWVLIVENNTVYTAEYEVARGTKKPVE